MEFFIPILIFYIFYLFYDFVDGIKQKKDEITNSIKLQEKRIRSYFEDHVYTAYSDEKESFQIVSFNYEYLTYKYKNQKLLRSKYTQFLDLYTNIFTEQEIINNTLGGDINMILDRIKSITEYRNWFENEYEKHK